MRLEELIDTYPDQLWLKFSPQEREEAWLQTQAYSNNAARWQACLNLLCVKQLLPCWESEPELQDVPVVFCFNDIATNSGEQLSTIWEFVNGSTITIGETKIVIVPEETSEASQWSVPQEWVDIPEWQADYYLAVQVDPENCWLRVYGYATYKQLKQEGTFDSLNRTYALDWEDLTEDLNIMLVAMSFPSSPKMQPPLLPSLSTPEAEELINKLGQPSSYSPRLNMPF